VTPFSLSPGEASLAVMLLRAGEMPVGPPLLQKYGALSCDKCKSNGLALRGLSGPVPWGFRISSAVLVEQVARPSVAHILA